MSFVKLRPGAIITIPEEHYCYGTGPLKLRLTAVERNLPRGVEWLWVRGVEQRWDGSEGAEREVLVRTAALPQIRES